MTLRCSGKWGPAAQTHLRCYAKAHKPSSIGEVHRGSWSHDNFRTCSLALSVQKFFSCEMLVVLRPGKGGQLKEQKRKYFPVGSGSTGEALACVFPAKTHKTSCLIWDHDPTNFRKVFRVSSLVSEDLGPFPHKISVETAR